MTDSPNSEGPIAAVGCVLLAAGLVAALSIAAGDAMAQKGQPVRLTPLQTLSLPLEQQPNPTRNLPSVIEKLQQTPSLLPLVEPAATPVPVKARVSQGIETDSLQSIDPDTVGTLSAARGGLGINMWHGTSRKLVERLLPHLPVNAPSLTMRDLMRRLLLSTAKVPAGPSAGTNLITLRVKRLAAMGDQVAVNSLLNAIPGQIRDQDLIRVETDSRFLANDNARACPLVASQIRDNDEPYWQKAFAFCQALAGEHDKAALGVGLLRETSDEDEVFFTLFDGLIAGEPPTIQSLADPTPLHLAIARVANAQLPVDVVLSNQPGVLRTVAMSPNASNGLRLEAAELAQAVGVLPIDSRDEWGPLLSTAAAERSGDISPDGDWITYESNETGVPEVYVEQFPDLGLKTQISTGGGQSPQWSPDGDEIFYRRPDTGALMAVQIGSEPTLTVAAPLLITDEYYARRGPYSFGFRMYDVFPDGERFLMFKETRATNHLIHVVLNAFRDLN